MLKKIFFAAVVAIATLTSCTENKPVDIKVVSFNIRGCRYGKNGEIKQDGPNHWEYRKASVVKFIEDEMPDLLGMQEVLTHQADTLKARIPSCYTLYSIDRVSGEPTGPEEAMTICYRNDRFTEVAKGTFWLSETPDTPSKGWDAECYRTVSWAHLKDKLNDNKDVLFFNTHFDHIGETARVEAGKLIIDRAKEILGVTGDIGPAMEKKGASIFVTGDFNCQIGTPSLVHLYNNFDYAREKAPITDSHHTYNGWTTDKNDPVAGKHMNVIDHIFFAGAVANEYKTVLDGYGVPFISDHYPIMLKATIK